MNQRNSQDAKEKTRGVVLNTGTAYETVSDTSNRPTEASASQAELQVEVSNLADNDSSPRSGKEKRTPFNRYRRDLKRQKQNEDNNVEVAQAKTTMPMETTGIPEQQGRNGRAQEPLPHTENTTDAQGEHASGENKLLPNAVHTEGNNQVGPETVPLDVQAVPTTTTTPATKLRELNPSPAPLDIDKEEQPCATQEVRPLIPTPETSEEEKRTAHDPEASFPANSTPAKEDATSNPETIVPPINHTHSQQHTILHNKDTKKNRDIAKPTPVGSGTVTDDLKKNQDIENQQQRKQQSLQDAETPRSRRRSLQTQLTPEEVMSMAESLAHSNNLCIFVQWEVVEQVEKGILPGTWMFNHNTLGAVDYLKPHSCNNYFWIRRGTSIQSGENEDQKREHQWHICLMRNISKLCDYVLNNERLDNTNFIADPFIFVFDSSSLEVPSEVFCAVRNFMNGTLRLFVRTHISDSSKNRKALCRIKEILDLATSHIMHIRMPLQPNPCMSGAYLLANLNFLGSEKNRDLLYTTATKKDKSLQRTVHFG